MPAEPLPWAEAAGWALLCSPPIQGSLRDSPGSCRTHHPLQASTPGLTRDTGTPGTCLCQHGSRSAEIPSWSKIQELVPRKTEPKKRGRRPGAKAALGRARQPHSPSRAGPGPPRGAPGPAAPPGALPPPETAPDFTRLWNGIPEISSQLSPDAPAVKTNPNYQRLLVPFLCHRHY